MLLLWTSSPLFVLGESSVGELRGTLGITVINNLIICVALSCFTLWTCINMYTNINKRSVHGESLTPMGNGTVMGGGVTVLHLSTSLVSFAVSYGVNTTMIFGTSLFAYS